MPMALTRPSTERRTVHVASFCVCLNRQPQPESKIVVVLHHLSVIYGCDWCNC
jgi:hypothetical protein